MFQFDVPQFIVPLILAIMAGELWVVAMKLDTIIANRKKP